MSKNAFYVKSQENLINEKIYENSDKVDTSYNTGKDKELYFPLTKGSTTLFYSNIINL